MKEDFYENQCTIVTFPTSMVLCCTCSPLKHFLKDSAESKLALGF